jgi:hypothetical protein
VVAAVHIMALFIVQLQWVQDFLTSDCNYCRLVNQKVHIPFLLSTFFDICGSPCEINSLEEFQKFKVNIVKFLLLSFWVSNKPGMMPICGYHHLGHRYLRFKSCLRHECMFSVSDMCGVIHYLIMGESSL